MPGRGRALDGRLDRSNRSRPGREPGKRARARSREQERVKRKRGKRERERKQHARRGGLRSPRQLLWNRCLDDTHSRMRVRPRHPTVNVRSQSKSLRALVSSVALASGITIVSTTTHRIPPPSPRCESSALFLSVSLPPFFLSALVLVVLRVANTRASERARALTSTH